VPPTAGSLTHALPGSRASDEGFSFHRAPRSQPRLRTSSPNAMSNLVANGAHFVERPISSGRPAPNWRARAAARTDMIPAAHT
jgi:hypothetical protein